MMTGRIMVTRQSDDSVDSIELLQAARSCMRRHDYADADCLMIAQAASWQHEQLDDTPGSIKTTRAA